MSAAQTLDHSWWLASRSAGVVAYLLLSASVLLGLAMALRLTAPRHTALLRTVHERVALLALGGVAAHGLLLLGDRWLRPGLTGVLVPFAMDYRPLWTGVGILGGYLAAALSLTYYARRRIGARRWRAVHRLIPIAWATAVVHVIGAGTDAGSLWLQVPLALTMSAVLTMLGHRVLARRPARVARPPRRAPVPAPTPATVAPARGYRPLWARDASPPRSRTADPTAAGWTDDGSASARRAY